MLTRFKAAPKGASAASAPAASFRSGRGAAAAAASQQAASADMTDDGQANDAAANASEAGAASLSSLAAASSLSGHKRTADPDSGGSASAAPSPASAAAAPSLSSNSKQLTGVFSEQQNKKQRGGSSSAGSSAAAAASSVGFESLAPPSTASAASSTGALSDQSKGVMHQQSGPGDEEREPHTAASSSSAAAASVSAERTPASGEAKLQSICLESQRLIRGVLSFAEAEVHRWSPAEAAEVQSKMHELAAARAELRAIPAEPTEEQANQRAIKQVQIEDLTEWLKLHGGLSFVLGCIDDARAAAHGPADYRTIYWLSEMCSLLLALENTCRLYPRITRRCSAPGCCVRTRCSHGCAPWSLACSSRRRRLRT